MIPQLIQSKSEDDVAEGNWNSANCPLLIVCLLPLALNPITGLDELAVITSPVVTANPSPYYNYPLTPKIILPNLIFSLTKLESPFTII